MRFVYLVLGLLSATIGTIGLYLPGLPTTVFYLFAAYCFSRSSERLHRKLTQSKPYKKLVQEMIIEGKATTRDKRSVFITLTIVFAICIILIPITWARIGLFVIYLAHIIGLSWHWRKRH